MPKQSQFLLLNATFACRLLSFNTLAQLAAAYDHLPPS